jgi:hypothetical protein
MTKRVEAVATVAMTPTATTEKMFLEVAVLNNKAALPPAE